jgi:hypothetical protein
MRETVAAADRTWAPEGSRVSPKWLKGEQLIVDFYSFLLCNLYKFFLNKMTGKIA